MPYEAIHAGALCSRRYYSYPMPGSIYTAPDDPRLVRGPTLVKLHNGRDMRVPANAKQNHAASSQGHDMGANNDVMKQLAALMHGKKHDGPEGMKGFGLKLPGFAPMPGREQNQLREGGVAGGGLHAHF